MRPPALSATDVDDDADHPPHTDTPSARVLMERAVTRVGTLAELARRLAVTPSHVSRLCRGLCGIGVDTCFALADVLDDDPLVVLRACGYARLSGRIDRLRRGLQPPPGARAQEAFDRLAESDRRLVGDLVNRLLADTRAPAAILVDPPKGGPR
jgi:transcriptional regulator with XRE-family HTH domain